MKIVRKTLGRLIDHYLIKRGNYRYNFFLSVYINFRYLPFRQAKFLPIALYGRPRIIAIGDGRISISAETIYNKMIKINKTNESVANSGGNSEIVFKGKMINFQGCACIGTGCRIMSYLESRISIGNNFIMNNQNFIGSCCDLEIGDNVVIGHQNQIFDTDFHFIYNESMSFVANNKAPTIIGEGVWISNRVSINKGSNIPPHTIIASNTVISRNITSISGLIWGGIPCKLLSTDKHKAIFNDLEPQLYGFFEENHAALKCKLSIFEYEKQMLSND